MAKGVERSRHPQSSTKTFSFKLTAVDLNARARIGFYGLSYGGKTAVRVPPLLENYALSICSADFNEWVWKNTSIDSPYSYLPTREYDMIEFDFANVVNYSDLANLMALRPFMVERGHDDGVAPDEWVAYEYAKVSLHLTGVYQLFPTTIYSQLPAPSASALVASLVSCQSWICCKRRGPIW
jgi:hypothetical protein